MLNISFLGIVQQFSKLASVNSACRAAINKVYQCQLHTVCLIVDTVRSASAMVILGSMICWRYVPSMGFFLLLGTTESICMGSFLEEGDGDGEGEEVDKKRSNLRCVGSMGDDPILRFFSPAIQWHSIEHLACFTTCQYYLWMLVSTW